jgi:hypothetical protein
MALDAGAAEWPFAVALHRVQIRVRFAWLRYFQVQGVQGAGAGGTLVFFLWQLEHANLFSGPRMMGRGGRYTRACFRRGRAREEASILEKSGSPSPLPSRSGSSVVLLGGGEDRILSLSSSMVVSGYAQGGELGLRFKMKVGGT